MVKKKPIFGGKKIEFPHTYLILLALCMAAILLTNILPAGEYDRELDENGRTVVISGTYHSVEPAPVSFLDLPVKLQEGMQAGGEIIFFMLVVGGALGIINEAGALDYFIRTIVARKLRGREKLFIPIMLTAMSLGGFTFGMTLEAAAFVPAVTALSCTLGYDSILAIAIIFFGSNIGYTAGIFNPYNVGVAQSIAELPIYSGAWFRWIFLFALLTVTSILLMRYGECVKHMDHEHRLSEKVASAPEPSGEKVPLRQWLGLLIFAIGFLVIIYGSIRLNWWIPQIGAVFFWMAVLTGILFRFSPNRMCALFADGAQSIVGGALSVGIARSIATILTDGRIIDTVVNGLAVPLKVIPKILLTPAMMVVQTIINLGIPTGSAQATATMPIIIPLTDLLGISRQAAVFAFQCGDGITNGIIPTYTTLITLLALAKVPYDKWLKFALKIVFTQWLTGFILCFFTNFIQY